MDTNIAFNILKFSPNPRSHELVNTNFHEAIHHIANKYLEIDLSESKRRLNWLALHGRWTEYLFAVEKLMRGFKLLFADAVSICLRFGMRKLACKIVDLYIFYSDVWGTKDPWNNLTEHLSTEQRLLISWLTKKADKYRLLKKVIKSDIPDYLLVGYLIKEMVQWLMQQKWMDFRRNQLLVWHEVSYVNSVIYVDLYSFMTIQDYYPREDIFIHHYHTRHICGVVTHSLMNCVIRDKDIIHTNSIDKLYDNVFSMINPIGTIAAWTIGERLTSLSLSTRPKKGNMYAGLYPQKGTMDIIRVN